MCLWVVGFGGRQVRLEGWRAQPLMVGGFWRARDGVGDGIRRVLWCLVSVWRLWLGWLGKLGLGGVGGEFVGWRGRMGETTGIGMDPHTIIKYWDAGLGQEGEGGV